MFVYQTSFQGFPGSSVFQEFSDASNDLRDCLANSAIGYDEFILSVGGNERKIRVSEIASLDLSQLSKAGSVLIEVIAPLSLKLISTLKFDSIEMAEAEFEGRPA